MEYKLNFKKYSVIKNDGKCTVICETNNLQIACDASYKNDATIYEQTRYEAMKRLAYMIIRKCMYQNAVLSNFDYCNLIKTV